MKTHNAVIYHCQRCGNVAHRDAEEERPHCCGQSMAHAAAKTVWDADETYAAQAAEHRTETATVTVPKKG